MIWLRGGPQRFSSFVVFVVLLSKSRPVFRRAHPPFSELKRSSRRGSSLSITAPSSTSPTAIGTITAQYVQRKVRQPQRQQRLAPAVFAAARVLAMHPHPLVHPRAQTVEHRRRLQHARLKVDLLHRPVGLALDQALGVHAGLRDHIDRHAQRIGDGGLDVVPRRGVARALQLGLLRAYARAFLLPTSTNLRSLATTTITPSHTRASPR